MKFSYSMLAHGGDIVLAPFAFLLIGLFFAGFPWGYKLATKPNTTLKHILRVVLITGLAFGLAYLLFGKELLWTTCSLPLTFGFVKLVRSTQRKV
jgi:hypothetical protein